MDTLSNTLNSLGIVTHKMEFIYDDSGIFKESSNNFNIRFPHVDDYILNFVSVFDFSKVAAKGVKPSIFNNVNYFMINRINDNTMIIRITGITFKFIDRNNFR